MAKHFSRKVVTSQQKCQLFSFAWNLKVVFLYQNCFVFIRIAVEILKFKDSVYLESENNTNNTTISLPQTSKENRKYVWYVTQTSKFTTLNIFQTKTGNLQWRSIQCDHRPTTFSKLEFISRQFRLCSIVRNDSVPRSKYGQ